MYAIFVDRNLRHGWLGALLKRELVVEVFSSEGIAELVVDDACLVPAFVKGESVPLAAGHACCLISLAFDKSQDVVCCVFRSDVSREFLVGLSI